MNAVGTLAVVLLAAAGGLVVGMLVARSSRRPAVKATPAGGLTVGQVLDRIVSSAQNGIAVVDRFGDVVLANGRAEELGITHERRMDEHAWRAVERVFRGREVTAVELPQGESRAGRGPTSVQATARPLSEDDTTFVVVEASDESEHVRLEATRRDFVANVSHELKTPVGAMALLAEALLESAEHPAEVQRFGGQLLHEANRLGALVTELIALSRLQGAERLPDLDVVDVDEVVAQALERSRVSAEAAGITVTADAPSGLEVQGDRSLLVTALTNLVENAVAYSPADSPVSVTRIRRGTDVEVSVTDRGIGIAAEHQERVFERFFRVDPARSRVTGGTGLGLAIVKHVAANHNGSVRVWSRPGTGSTFTLQIPVHDEDDAGAVPDLEPQLETTSRGGHR